jgi:hypothetical protein
VTQVKEPSDPLDRGLRGHESRPGSHGEKKNLSLFPEIEPLLFDQPAGSLLVILSEELNLYVSTNKYSIYIVRCPYMLTVVS